MFGRYLKNRGFVTILALSVLTGISELSLNYIESVELSIQTYENIEIINEDLLLKRAVLAEFKKQLSNEEIPSEYVIENTIVHVYENQDGYTLKYQMITLELTVENGEIVKISH